MKGRAAFYGFMAILLGVVAFASWQNRDMYTMFAALIGLVVWGSIAVVSLFVKKD